MRHHPPSALAASSRARSLSPGPQQRSAPVPSSAQRPRARQLAAATATSASRQTSQYYGHNAAGTGGQGVTPANKGYAALAAQRIGSAVSPSSPAASTYGAAVPRHHSPPPAVSGLTRTEMFNSATPELTKRLQGELAGLIARVADETPHHLHQVRQIDDMVSEVLARWRRSIRTAIDSMGSLEQELVRKGEALSSAHAKLADKDVALASMEAEKQALRGYAMRLETYVAKLVEQLSEAEASGAGTGTSSPNGKNRQGQGTSSSAQVETAVSRLLNAARAGAGLDGMPMHTATQAAVASLEVDQLSQAVRAASLASSPVGTTSQSGATSGSPVPSGSNGASASEGASSLLGNIGGNQRVRAFFDALDATYNTGGGSSAKNAAPRAAGAAQQAALKSIDETLDRAIASVNKSQAVSPGKGSSPSARSPAPVPRVDETQKAASAPLNGRVASLYVEFDPALHARATVSMLKAAVGVKSGRKLLSIGYGGRTLVNDKATLSQVGVPLQAYIDVVFAPEEGADGAQDAVGTARPTIGSTSSVATGAPVRPSFASGPASEPAAQPLPPSKRSPPPRAHALMSPAPHAAPRTIGYTDYSALAVSETSQAGGEGPEGVGVPGEGPAATVGEHLLAEEEEATAATPAQTNQAASAPASSPSVSLSPSAAGFTPLLKRAGSMGKLDLEVARAEAARLLSLSQGDDGRAAGSIFHAALAHPSQKPQREAVAASIFARVDVDGSGTVEWAELVEYTTQVREKAQRDAEKAQKGTSGEAAADQADDDDDDADEVIAPDGVPYAVHAAFASVLLDTGLEAAFHRFDDNGDGVLSLQEFTTMVEQVLTGKFGSHSVHGGSSGSGSSAMLHGAAEGGSSEERLALIMAQQEETERAAAAAAAARAQEAATTAALEAEALKAERDARAAAAMEAAQALAEAQASTNSSAGAEADPTDLAERAAAMRAAAKRAGAAALPTSPAGKKPAGFAITSPTPTPTPTPTPAPVSSEAVSGEPTQADASSSPTPAPEAVEESPPVPAASRALIEPPMPPRASPPPSRKEKPVVKAPPPPPPPAKV